MTDTQIRQILDQLPHECAFQLLMRGLYQLGWKQYALYTYVAPLFMCFAYLNEMISFKTVCFLLPITGVPLILLGSKFEHIYPMGSSWIILRYHTLRIVLLFTKIMCGLFVLRCAKEQIIPSSSAYFTILFLIILGMLLLEHVLEHFGPWCYVQEADNNEGEKA